ncbi:WbqC family protein [bacterium]|nr:WbqC family protein [bacterium]
MKKIAIIQSSYIPWKGYFHIIKKSDIFVFLEDVQYTRRDWRNKNFIKSVDGGLPLIIPVKGGTHQLISEVTIDIQQNWQKEHLKTIIQNYKTASFFEKYKFLLDELYVEHKWHSLSKMNIYMIKKISEILGIQAEFKNSADYRFCGEKTEKIVNICKDFNADHYISGPRAKSYIDPQLFRENNITLEYMDYSKYPEYPQLYFPFEHRVSILDMLFNLGPDTGKYIWGDKL